MKKTGGIFHDRFIVLDYGTADERVFLCGASSKDAGARITSIVEDYGTAKYNSVVAGLLKNSPLVLPKQECEIIEQSQIDDVLAKLIMAMPREGKFKDAIQDRIGATVDTSDLEKQLSVLNANNAIEPSNIGNKT